MSRLLSVLALVLLIAAPAQAQRRAEWQLLGQQTVSFRVDRDVIEVTRNEDWYRNRAFRALHFGAERNDVHLMALRIVYINGYAEDLAVDRLIRQGSFLDVDLRGERSYLRRIEMTYRSRPDYRGQAVIKVYGEPVRSVRPGPGPDGGWSEIDTRRFDRRDGEVVFRVERGEGRFGQLRLRATEGRVNITRLDVRFRNGESQTIGLAQRLESGEQTAPLDLRGELRGIETVTVYLRPGFRPGAVALQLSGSHRAGRPEPTRPEPVSDLVPLGQQSVSFVVDRDVITVGQSEDWYRNRMFRRLVFRAERNDVHMMAVRVVYLNGYAEDFQIDRLIRQDSELPVDLAGERSYIRQIEMTYRARPSFAGQALIKVFGEPVRRRER